MCITVNHASLSRTKILSLPLNNGNHFLAYSNTVENLSGKPNAMILPIPGKTKQDWFYDTTNYKDFLDEITDNCRLNEDYLGMHSRGMKGGLSADVVFQLGQYTVYLADNLKSIINFLKQTPADEQPEISNELADFFEEKYAGWSFAACIFDSGKTIDAQPIAFEYKPFNKNLIYFPTVDAHNGGAPNLKEDVETDHTFIYEHTGSMDLSKKNKSLSYEKKFVTLQAKVPDFLNNRKYRAEYIRGKHLNADTCIYADKLKELDFLDTPSLKRVHPIPVTEDSIVD